MLPWLLDSGSLTQRLVSVCPGQFRVRVESQRRARPLREEARALGMRAGQLALVRQVVLSCDRQAWVCARTVIPASTLTGTERRLMRLGNRSLGAVLFADPTLERGATEVACLTPGRRLYDLLAAPRAMSATELWGRRSVFRLSGKPLLVSEFFLPVIPDFPS